MNNFNTNFNLEKSCNLEKSNFHDYLYDFFGELKEECLTNLRNNTTYIETLHRLEQMQHEIMHELSLVNNENKIKFDKMLEIQAEVDSMLQDSIYEQGYLDCIQLLKALKML